jgi:hypothetical protein
MLTTGNWEPETQVDWLILEAIAKQASLPLVIHRAGETSGTQITPTIIRYQNYTGIPDCIRAEYDLPFDDTLFGVPATAKAAADVMVRTGSYPGTIEIYLTNWRAKSQFSLLKDYSGSYATLPWNTANQAYWMATWDDNNRESRILD